GSTFHCDGGSIVYWRRRFWFVGSDPPIVRTPLVWNVRTRPLNDSALTKAKAQLAGPLPGHRDPCSQGVAADRELPAAGVRGRPVEVSEDPEGVAVGIGRQSLELDRFPLVQAFAPLRERPSPNRFKVREVFGQIRVGLNCFGIELPVGKF